MKAYTPHTLGKEKIYLTKEVIAVAKLPRLSITNTIGEGSEKHNHDPKYRAGLEHVKAAGKPDGLIELVEYKVPYEQQIDARRKAAIDRYNARQDERYEAAWARYRNGEIKSKPKKKDFPKKEYDYCAQWHKKYDDMPDSKRGKPKLWREQLIGFGDQKDRLGGVITDEQAERIARYVTDKWKQEFPLLPILGATLHLDEPGFPHMHVDYDVCYEKDGGGSRDLDVGSCFEDALEKMGIPKEQSIVNERDKAPLRFNGFRNKIFRWVEEAYQREGILWDKGCTERKAPGKDAGVHTSLERWQATQDAERAIQAEKNEVLDVMLPIIQNGEPLTQEQIDHAAKHAAKMGELLKEVDQTEYTFNRKERKLSVKLFDQMRTVWGHAAESLATMSKALTEAIASRDAWKARYDQLKAKANAKVAELAGELRAWQAAHAKLEKENAALQDELEQYKPEEPQGLEALIGAAQLTPEQRTIAKLQDEIKRRDEYMSQYAVTCGDGSKMNMADHCAEEIAAQRAQERRSGHDAR